MRRLFWGHLLVGAVCVCDCFLDLVFVTVLGLLGGAWGGETLLFSCI